VEAKIVELHATEVCVGDTLLTEKGKGLQVVAIEEGLMGPLSPLWTLRDGAGKTTDVDTSWDSKAARYRVLRTKGVAA